MELNIENGMNNLFKYMDLHEDDVVLYMGGRVDDDNLYPQEYSEYLNKKIRQLNPDIIICHTHWYAGKYYDRGILDPSTKINVITTYFDHFNQGPRETINPDDYQNQLETLTRITNINPEMIYATYHCKPSETPSIPTVDIKPEVINAFSDKYNLENIKYFYFDRRYKANDLVEVATADLSCLSEEEKSNYTKITNATDGFAIINSFLDRKFDNLHIIGFSAFGSDEDMTHFTPYACKDNGPTVFKNRKYFNIQTSENQRLESDILETYVENGIINNLENYDELLFHLQGKNNECV